MRVYKSLRRQIGAKMQWHAATIDEIFSALNSSRRGLSNEEAEKRQLQHGKNTIESKQKVNPLKIFLRQFSDFLVLILVAAAIISFAMSFMPNGEEHVIDAILITAILVANAIIGFFQEYKAEKSIIALKKLAAPHARVLRDGKEKKIIAELLVPGDIIILEQGDKVPADARIIEQANLQVDESMLTGESLPVSKKECVLKEETSLADRKNMLYMNTLVTRGRAKAIVVATGTNTEVGKIAKQIAETEEKPTPFQLELDRLGKSVGIAILIIITVVALTQYIIINDSPVEIFLRAVSLAVAAVPEGLPAIVTIALTIGIKRMAKRNALARTLPVAESLGSVNVICTDKTGTLTENVMTVQEIFFNMEKFKVTGEGYSTDGEFYKDSEKVDSKQLLPILKCGILCNDASEYKEENKVKYIGDPTEIALLISAKKAGLDVEIERNKMQRIQEIPFSSERKMMSVVCAGEESKKVYAKGAPEVIIERCNRILINGKVKELDEKTKELILKVNSDMGKRALRVLAFAFKDAKETENEKEIEKDLIFLGLQGMLDPPRAGVKEAIDDCRKAGIKVIMVTGDNIETAKAIGKELGFKTDYAINSQALDKISNEELKEVLEKTEIFARVSPTHKVRILETLQAKGKIVAMTGDGVNDAPALKKADVGIAMGIRGTDVAKETSDLILLDDNFITIRDAIEEGRGIFDNIRKFVNYLLSSNLAEVLVVFLFTLMEVYMYFGERAAILTAVQLLWINLLTDGMPAVALGLDPKAKGLMQRKPRPKTEGVINKQIAFSIASIGLTMTAIILGLFMYSFFTFQGEIQERFLRAQTIAFTCFVVFELVRVQMVRARYKINLFSNKWLWSSILASLMMQLIILYTPLNKFFKIVPLGFYEWFVIFVGMAVFLLTGYLIVKLESKVFGDEYGAIRSNE